ncbi:hypothetical protein BY996DRAFT_6414919 [Phakopsora pachyrhizi]|nr:hypothetical protein BY996DRAFT_6414919 [Phakopsora pachyrhizi]
MVIGDVIASLRELCFKAEFLATSMYTKPQGTLPEANISSLALRTSAVKSSRWYAFLRGGGSQANSLADCFLETLARWFVRLLSAAQYVQFYGGCCCTFHCAAAAVAQYEKGVSCNP